MNIFGDFIRERREAKGMTLYGIGSSIGFKNRQNFWNAEHGHNHGNMNTLSRMAEVLDVPVKELVCRKYLDKLSQDAPDISMEKLNQCLSLLLS